MRHLRLLATDLDGTLLHSDKRISPRTRRALNLARAAGVEIVLVTGRPPRFLRTVAAELEIASAAICGNGALVYDPARDLIIRHVPIPGTMAAEIVMELREAAPGVCFACERGLHLGCEPEYLARFPHAKHEAACTADALTLCREPISKLIAYHTGIPVQELSAAGPNHRRRPGGGHFLRRTVCRDWRPWSSEVPGTGLALCRARYPAG